MWFDVLCRAVLCCPVLRAPTSCPVQAESTPLLSQMLDPEERVAAVRALVGLIGSDCPNIPIATAAHMYVASDRVHDLVCSPLYLLDFSRCWLSVDE